VALFDKPCTLARSCIDSGLKLLWPFSSSISHNTFYSRLRLWPTEANSGWAFLNHLSQETKAPIMSCHGQCCPCLRCPCPSDSLVVSHYLIWSGCWFFPPEKGFNIKARAPLFTHLRHKSLIPIAMFYPYYFIRYSIVGIVSVKQ
jgi:hypothetical protein